jgi:hypothetical protein
LRSAGLGDRYVEDGGWVTSVLWVEWGTEMGSGEVKGELDRAERFGLGSQVLQTSDDFSWALVAYVGGEMVSASCCLLAYVEEGSAVYGHLTEIVLRYFEVV